MRQIKEDRKQTTVRLPKTLHTQLKEAAIQAGVAAESVIEMAIRHELERMGVDELPMPSSWEPLLAQRFLEFMPTPAVIKDSEWRIVWCNLAYEDLFQRPKGYLLGKKITELGLLDPESTERIDEDQKVMRDAVRADNAIDFWEPLTLPLRDGATSLFRAHRFVFHPGKSRPPFFGDISFDWGQIRPGYIRDMAPDLLARLRTSVVPKDIGDLFATFLRDCPAAIAVKDPGAKMVWCNAQYEKLAEQKLVNLEGKTSKQIFRLSDTHPIVQNEFTVARLKRWMYVEEALPNHKPRTSLRFPLTGPSGAVAFLGVVSANFRQDEVHLLRGFRRHRRSKRAG